MLFLVTFAKRVIIFGTATRKDEPIKLEAI